MYLKYCWSLLEPVFNVLFHKQVFTVSPTAQIHETFRLTLTHVVPPFFHNILFVNISHFLLNTLMPIDRDCVMTHLNVGWMFSMFWFMSGYCQSIDSLSLKRTKFRAVKRWGYKLQLSLRQGHLPSSSSAQLSPFYLLWILHFFLWSVPDLTANGHILCIIDCGYYRTTFKSIHHHLNMQICSNSLRYGFLNSLSFNQYSALPPLVWLNYVIKLYAY